MSCCDEKPVVLAKTLRASCRSDDEQQTGWGGEERSVRPKTKKKKWVSDRTLVEGSTRELKAVFSSPHGVATFLYSIAGLEWFATT